MNDEIESPCTGVCRLDDRQLCTGCFRTMDEIIAWPTAGPDTRLRILGAVAQRKNETPHDHDR